ncbi:MFS transporter, DHA2 family, multidrug resistance protein [Streptomyces zhaozhouensis]|uniref:MFS transporter, DHA2 family, multidrug resistance protein n=1 Tax=Streptomyces zhaozhouensis TaxID=1300267 RepID=A0A286DM55_9ACTN|nr:MFS transporter [Streptomyces zhaozhouensis]SOD59574.1 MFS transporter, DHA2 family, multidrug resistance protein [Streptomyces zhaozhouensis]
MTDATVPSPSGPSAPPPRAGRREWTAFTVLLLPLLLVSMDVSVLYFAIPALSADLEPTSTQQLWIFDIYAFIIAGLLITMGSLGDRIGPRKLLLLGATAFGLASLAAAYATNPEMLIAARALLGIGGATLMPSTLSLVRRIFRDEKQRSTAIAIWSGALAGGVALGSVLSGMLLEFFWWGSVFLINLPAMVLLLVAVPLLVPEFRDPDSGKFDLISVPLSMAAVLPIVYALKEFAAEGFELTYLVSMLVGFGFVALFVYRQRTYRHPMVDPALFRNSGFSAVMVLNSLIMFAMMGQAYFTAQYLQSVLGKSALEAALWSLLPSVAVLMGAPLAAAAAQAYGRRPVIVTGFFVASGGFVVLTQVGTDSLWVLLAGAGVLGGGVVGVLSQVVDIALGISPSHQAGSVSALSETSTELGGALGMAVLGSIGTAVFRNDIEESLPEGIPAEAAEAAGETMAGAVHVATSLPGPMAEELLAAAREAYTNGFNLAAVVGAVLLLGATLLAAFALRGVPAAEKGAPPVDHGDGSVDHGDGSVAVPPADQRTAEHR